MFAHGHATRILVRSADPCIAHSCVEILRARGFSALVAGALDGEPGGEPGVADVVLAWCEDEDEAALLLGDDSPDRLVVCAYARNVRVPAGARVVPLPFDGSRVEQALRETVKLRRVP